MTRSNTTTSPHKRPFVMRTWRISAGLAVASGLLVLTERPLPSLLAGAAIAVLPVRSRFLGGSPRAGTIEDAAAPERIPLDVVLVIDLSTPAGRPYGPVHRLAAASRLLQLLAETNPGTRASASQPGTPAGDRLGLVLAAPARADVVPLTDLSSWEGRRRLDGVLRPRPGRVGPTAALAPALWHAARLLRAAAAPQPARAHEALPLVLVLTDGRSGEPAAELAGAVAAVSPGCVHVLATEEPSVDWWGVPVASITRLDQSPITLDVLDRVVTKALLLTATVRSPRQASPSSHRR